MFSLTLKDSLYYIFLYYNNNPLLIVSTTCGLKISRWVTNLFLICKSYKPESVQTASFMFREKYLAKYVWQNLTDTITIN